MYRTAALLSLLLLGAAMAGSARFKAGVISAIQGRVELLVPGKAAVTLTSKDTQRDLFVGDMLRCAKDAILWVTYRTGAKERVPTTGKWHLIELRRTREEQALWTALTGGGDPLRAAVRAAVKPKARAEPVVPDRLNVPTGLFQVLLPEGFRANVAVRIVRAGAMSDGDSGGQVVYSESSFFGPILKNSALCDTLRLIRDSGYRGPFDVVVSNLDGSECKLTGFRLMDVGTERRLGAALASSVLEGDDYAKNLHKAHVLKTFGLIESAGLVLYTEVDS